MLGLVRVQVQSKVPLGSLLGCLLTGFDNFLGAKLIRADLLRIRADSLNLRADLLNLRADL